MVTIVLPSLYTAIKLEAGKIFKTLSRIETIQVELPIFHPENQTITFKYKGDNVLITAKKASGTLASGFRYVLKCSDISEIDLSLSVLDLRKLVWQKHPLSEDIYSRKLTRDYIKQSWKEVIKYKSDKTSEQGLRTPQLGALYAIQSHWTVSDEAGIVVLPTGTGKTDTMIATLIASEIDTLLVIVPTDALRNQLARNFCALGVLPTVGIVGEECESPIVGIIEHKFKTKESLNEFLDHCNVIVATMSVMGYQDSNINLVLSKRISHLFIDEAHHTPAETWSKFRMQFENSKTLLFTATPFRNDGKRLDGKIIFNFPLKKAQEMDYFRPIIFKPIREYDLREADRLIAEAAVDQLAKDLAAGYDHILMVRVNKINRANEIYPYYEAHAAYRPVIIHSQIKPASTLKEMINSIISKQHRIIICVDMLGEGFDLPELKIAAFHDTKKSLTITLQLAGRFTRVKPNLGPATFIANIADPEVTEDLEDLYYQDSDWNSLLPDLSYKMSLDQEDFRKFLEGFKGFPDKFPIQSIRNPLSTIIFESPSDKWSPLKYKEGIKSIDSFQYKYADYNKEMELLVVILGKRSTVKWAKVQDFESVDWSIIICYFDKATKLLYL
ncbi:MAG: DEAD/DEAH box helicase family protein, partial [Chitinophagaceae bacterium]|nr:DEAD/DEAH box helicase family protein [Chitinophagaceae bacterium]